MYKLAPLGVLSQTQDIVIRVADNLFIPTHESNSDYQAYLKWLEEGNTPLPADTQE